MWRGKRGGGGKINRMGGLLVLTDEVEARAVFPLGTGNTDVGHWNPGPPDTAVGGPYYSDYHSTLHITADT